jgi:hypothetical protein
MMTSRLSRCHQTPGRVAAKEFLFQRARCVSVMVRGENFIPRFAKGGTPIRLHRKCARTDLSTVRHLAAILRRPGLNNVRSL